MYRRILQNSIENKIGRGKAIILIGPRQVGKTTLIQEIIKNREILFIDGDDPTARALLTEPNTEQIRRILKHYKFVFVDEAQRIPGIGVTLKIITDQFKDVQLFISGSSFFDLNSTFNEPLTGRKWEFSLFPISWEEFENKVGYLKSEQDLENRLLYGFYPDIMNNKGEEIERLKNLVNSYLYKDVLSFTGIRKPEMVEKLLKALAYQVGNEVNYNELAQHINVDKNTISKYIQLLEEGFVIFRLSSYSSNQRNEIKTNKKIYFYDNGVRNLLIGNFNSLESRMDKGALWENFLISERLKLNAYHRDFAKLYFWRSKQQQEVDLVEELNGEITGFEFKWKARKSVHLPKTFVRLYNAKEKIIDSTNFRDFVLE
jgi:predicted AAA+ superfamily ATPase